MVDQDNSQNQLTHKHASPHDSNQPMAKTHRSQFPGDVESRLPLRIRAGHKMPSEIKHHRTRQQQRDETSEAKSASEHGFADQQEARVAAEEQGDTVGADPKQ